MLILMKGHPCSGKSTIASKLAAELRCALIDKDDVKSDLVAELGRDVVEDRLNILSYRIAFRLVETQLKLGLDCIFDSPLARRSHFDALVDLASKIGTEVALIECEAVEREVWRSRVESRTKLLKGTSDEHRAFAWDELTRLIERYNRCFEWSKDPSNLHNLGLHRLVDTTASDATSDKEIQQLVAELEKLRPQK